MNSKIQADQVTFRNVYVYPYNHVITINGKRRQRFERAKRGT